MDFRLRGENRTAVDKIVELFTEKGKREFTLTKEEVEEEGMSVRHLGASKVVYTLLHDHRIDVSKEGSGEGLEFTVKPFRAPSRPLKASKVGAKGKKKHTFHFPNCAYFVYENVEQDDVVWLTGPTGCGKTTMFRLMARMQDRVPYRCSVRPGIEAHHIAGEKTLEADEDADGQVTVNFVKGVLVRAMLQGCDPDTIDMSKSVVKPEPLKLRKKKKRTKPGMFIAEEMDSIEPATAFMFHELLEDPENGRRRFTLDQDRGQVIYAHPGFRFGAIGNTKGRGSFDESDALFAGTQQQNAAFLNRFTSVWEIGYNKEAEFNVATELVPDDPDFVEKLMKFRDGMRIVIREGAVSGFFSTRDMVNVCHKFARLQGVDTDIDLAAVSVYSAFGSKFSDGEKASIYEVFQREFGTSMHEQVEGMLDDMDL